MKIAIDCRYIGKSGIGRVCQGILDNLDYSANDYYLIGDPDKLTEYSQKGASVLEDKSNPFSKRGLFGFPRQINKLCDCIIIPNFIIPFGIKIPVYTVIHDLIFLDLPKVTTRGFVDRAIKNCLMRRAVRKSVRIACVSDFTRQRCLHYFPRYAHKYFVNYNGLSKDVLAYDGSHTPKTNSIIYVGNVKPHKGLKTLIEAYKALPKGKYVLKIIGERDGFLTGMDKSDLETEGVEFTGRLSNDDLLREMSAASFLVQPSLYEGFGLPPLEALWVGTQPIVSDIPVFREVYRDLPVIFFSDGKQLTDILAEVQPQRIKRPDIPAKFSYKKFAERLLSCIDVR